MITSAGKTQQEQLENFYKHQAFGYDAFRERLLPGRGCLLQQSISQVLSENSNPFGLKETMFI